MGRLYKLSRIGFSDQVLKWFSSYLLGRRQCVVLCGAVSGWAPGYAGVLQGSINDTVANTNCSIRLFADDTSLYIVGENPQTAALTVNVDLRTTSKWAWDWLIDFNERKTVSFLVSKNRSK